MTMTQTPPLTSQSFEVGAEWTFTNRNTGEVRQYAIQVVWPAGGDKAALYKLRNLDTYPDPLPKEEWATFTGAWATHGGLTGICSTKGWAPA